MGNELQVMLAEEIFHTIQYCSWRPKQICMYHKAYKAAMERGLYTTDASGPEVDGEPVPTIQADEYMAMALQRWFGSTLEQNKEYFIPGNTGHQTGREILQKKDPKAFCLLSTLFRADDSWNPDPEELPWRDHPNKVLSVEDVA